MKEVINRFLRQIRDDNRSGASEIAEKAAECLIMFVESFEGNTRKELIRELYAVGRKIIEAQPTMAPLFNLVNGALLDTEKAKTLEKSRLCVKEIAKEFMKASAEGWKTIADYADTVVREGSTILVHSYSATLYRVLLTLHDRRRDFSVICTESRPLREGLTLARRMAEKGISVRLIVDTATFQLLDHVSLVFVGADAISPLGVTNKIGTYGLAAAAQCKGVPFYVLAGIEKCLVTDARVELERERRPPSEITETEEPMEVLNFYFDRTPLELVSGVITEKGIWKGEELQKYFMEFRIHPFLADWQEKRR